MPLEQAIPRYEQALDCYCGRDGKIGSTYRGVGKQRCQELCIAEPKCVAFEMYRGGDDCTLRPHCPDPRMSEIGTFLVLFAHRNNGSLFPSDLAMMCSGPSSAPTLPPSGLLPMVTAAPSSSSPPPTTTSSSSSTEGSVTVPVDVGRVARGGRESTTTSGIGAGGTTYYIDWSKVRGGRPAARSPSTTPLYRIQEGSSDALLPSPPFGGTRVVQSETCSEAFDMLWSEGCEVDHLLWQFKRTCEGSGLQDWEKACKSWFGAGITGNAEVDDASVEECTNNAKRIEEKEWLGTYAAPTSAEEGNVCFGCTSVTCIVSASYSGPALTFDGNLPTPSPTVPPTPMGHWSPDGSVNHCRPTQGGQVSGPQKRVRREVHLWTDQEWLKFENAIQIMKHNGRYAAFANNFTRRLAPELPEFTLLQSLPWIRRFLLDFETEVQVAVKDCDVTLPFWTASLEASPAAFQNSIVWSATRLGGKPLCANGGPPCDKPAVSGGQQNCPSEPSVYCLGNGIASGWLVEGPTEDCACVHRSPSLQASLVTQPTLFRFLGGAADLMSISSRLGSLAAYMLCQVAGADSTLCTPKLAAWDPLFFLLQADLDRLFLKWQRYRAYKHMEDTTNFPGCEQLLTLYGQPIAEMLGNFETASRGEYIELPKSNPTVSVAYQEAYDPARALQLAG